MAEAKRRTYTAKPSFGDTAPSYSVPFPRKASMTVAEILAFLPNSINCADVVYRIVSNGGTRKSVHAMINSYRNFKTEWSANCCGEAMYKTMNKAGFTDWTIKKHELWHAGRKASWDADNLNVGNLRTPSGGLKGAVSFSSLAENVRMMPEGDDALDLTRMVRYCADNSEDGWKYPEDYEELLELLGGPAEVRDPNTDGAVFGRWETRKAPPPTPSPVPSPQPPQRVESLKDRRTPRKRSDGPNRPSAAENGQKMMSPGLGSSVRHRVARGSARITTDFAVEMETTEQDELEQEDEKAYKRGPASTITAMSSFRAANHTDWRQAEYAPPPPPTSDTTSSLTSLDLRQIFQVEGRAGETDAYSAYAFGGPRRTPPYRRLEQIEPPHPWDASGWAENLRWAFEQRVLFAQSFPDVLVWTESPGHMAHIERERTQGVWASDELLEQLMDGD